ncbi:fascin-3 isoform X1 [Carcharodon carcharias]|uniref:fascin-3 isoform X1 n=1 Tax=Carcharodon carcharias TaxID=13397 RepID=UPI001B7E17BE|nr:fascin-3 isoform X1 [Carcharodon carcharias]
MVIKRLSNTITLYRNNTKAVAGAPRPLLVLFPWLGAKPRAVECYRQIYYPYGFDILTVESNILHFLWPRYGLSYASEVLDLLHSEPLSSHPLVIHAFSIGGFLFVQMIVATLRDAPRYSGFEARIMGQIFDSLVVGDVELMAKGVELYACFENLTQLSLFQFEINLNSDQVRLRTINGQLLAQRRQVAILADGKDTEETTYFTMKWCQGKVTLQAANKQYLTMKPIGQIVASAQQAGPNEMFTVRLVNRPFLILRGKYGYIATDCHSDQLQCSRSNYEIIRLTHCKGDFCHFQGNNGKFWSMRTNGIFSVSGETPLDFSIEIHADNLLTVKAPNGCYLCTDRNGILRASNTTINSDSLWEF